MRQLCPYLHATFDLQRQELDCFDRIEALINGGGENMVEEVRTLLNQFTDRSQRVAVAIDELLLELMTLVFLTEAGQEALQRAALRLAHMRLSKLKLLLGLMDLSAVFRP